MGLSRNKVAVPEGAAGSPPFYGEYGMPFGVRCGPSRAVVACGRVAGVEDVVGFAPPVVRWVPEWYGCAFGLPDRHPRLLPGAIRCPSCLRAGRVPVWLAWRCVVA